MPFLPWPHSQRIKSAKRASHEPTTVDRTFQTATDRFVYCTVLRPPLEGFSRRSAMVWNPRGRAWICFTVPRRQPPVIRLHPPRARAHTHTSMSATVLSERLQLTVLHCAVPYVGNQPTGISKRPEIDIEPAHLPTTAYGTVAAGTRPRLKHQNQDSQTNRPCPGGRAERRAIKATLQYCTNQRRPQSRKGFPPQGSRPRRRRIQIRVFRNLRPDLRGQHNACGGDV
jgi:hypothetical protein